MPTVVLHSLYNSSSAQSLHALLLPDDIAGGKVESHSRSRPLIVHGDDAYVKCNDIVRPSPTRESCFDSNTSPS